MDLTITSLTQNAMQIGDAQKRFLRDTLFTTRRNFPTDVIDISDYRASVRVLPALSPSAPGSPIQAGTGILRSLACGRIRPTFTIGRSDAGQAVPGLPGFNYRSTNPNAQLMALVGVKQGIAIDSIALTEEIWCALLLQTGTLSLLDADGTTVVGSYDFGYSTAGGGKSVIRTALDGTSAWSSASSKPLRILQNMEDEIRQNSTYGGPLMVIMGANAAAAFEENDSVLKYLNKQGLNAGELTWQQNFIGRLKQWAFYRYSLTYATAQGTSKNQVWDPDTIAMLPTDSSAFALFHGAVFERMSPDTDCQFIQGELVSGRYRFNNPARDEYYVESCPAPAILDPKVFRIQKVL